jgi:hypothetical protein
VRVLIWGVSFGERTAGLMTLWAKALRRFARWRGEIVVLGDARVRPLEADGVRVFDITRRATQIVNWEERRATNLKPWIVDYVDPRRSDFLLYLDADVLATAPRLEQLLAGPISRGMIAVQRDILTVGGNHRCSGRETLTDEEKRIHADAAICAGIVGVPTTATGLGLLNDWHEAIKRRKYPPPPADQTLLIPLLLRAYLGRWEHFEDTVIARSTTHPEALQHFSNRGGMAEKKLGREDRLFYETFARLAGAGAGVGSSAA